MKNDWRITLSAVLPLLLVVLSQRVGMTQSAALSPAASTSFQRLMPSDFVGSDRFGTAIAVDEDTMAIGANYQNNIRGSVYLFDRNNGVWSETQKVLASDGTGSDQFGSQVAISGDTMIASAPQASVYGYTWHGAVYVYERNAGGANNWGQVKKLEDLFGDREARFFGDALAIQGDLIAVGSPSEDDYGAVILFERNEGGPDNWGVVKRITTENGNIYSDNFGSSVAFYGDLLVVGHKRYAPDIDHLFQGAAHIFERNAGGTDNWGEVKMLFDPQGTPNDQFGHAVAAGEDVVVIGAQSADVGSNITQGAVYVYGRDSGGQNNWGLIKKITAPNGEGEDYFGTSVALSDDYLLVGADGDDVFYKNQGSAYLFARNEGGANNWGLVDVFVADDGRENDYFGTAVALSGDSPLIGASGVDSPSTFEYQIGAVYVTGIVDYAVYVPYIQK